MKSLPFSRSCFVCGTENQHGLKMRFFTEEDGGIRGNFRLTADHVGFRGVAHGGILATVLDEAMAWAAAVKMRQFGFAGELNVRFLKPVTVDRELIVRAGLVADHKRLWDLRGDIRDPDNILYAKATAKYVPLNNEQAQAFLEDLRWDETTFTPAEILGTR